MIPSDCGAPELVGTSPTLQTTDLLDLMRRFRAMSFTAAVSNLASAESLLVVKEFSHSDEITDTGTKIREILDQLSEHLDELPVSPGIKAQARKLRERYEAQEF